MKRLDIHLIITYLHLLNCRDVYRRQVPSLDKVNWDLTMGWLNGKKWDDVCHHTVYTVLCNLNNNEKEEYILLFSNDWSQWAHSWKPACLIRKQPVSFPHCVMTPMNTKSTAPMMDCWMPYILLPCMGVLQIVIMNCMQLTIQTLIHYHWFTVLYCDNVNNVYKTVKTLTHRRGLALQGETKHTGKVP